MVTIGSVVVTIDAFIGEVSDTPNMKTPWFMIMPSRAANASSFKSAKGTRSRFTKSEAIQNATAAPITLKETNIHGLIEGSPMASFDSGAINPHEILAAIIARCPFSLF